MFVQARFPLIQRSDTKYTFENKEFSLSYLDSTRLQMVNNKFDILALNYG